MAKNRLEREKLRNNGPFVVVSFETINSFLSSHFVRMGANDTGAKWAPALLSGIHYAE